MTFWPTLAVAEPGENAMFCMLIETVPPEEVAAVLVPAGACVSGAGVLDEDLLPLLPPQPATPTTARRTRSVGFMPRTLPRGQLRLTEFDRDRCMVGQPAAFDDPRRPGGGESAGEHVVDAMAARMEQAPKLGRPAHVEGAAADGGRAPRPAERGLGRVPRAGGGGGLGVPGGVHVAPPPAAVGRQGGDAPPLWPAAQPAAAMGG